MHAPQQPREYAPASWFLDKITPVVTTGARLGVVAVLLTATALAVVLLFNGVIRLADVAYPFVLIGAVACTCLSAVLAVPLVLFKRIRRFGGWELGVNAVVVGVLAWIQMFLCMAETYGKIVTIIAVLFFGVGIVPLTLVACVRHQFWELLAGLVGEGAIIAATIIGAKAVLD